MQIFEALSLLPLVTMLLLGAGKRVCQRRKIFSSVLGSKPREEWFHQVTFSSPTSSASWGSSSDRFCILLLLIPTKEFDSALRSLLAVSGGAAVVEPTSQPVHRETFAGM